MRSTDDNITPFSTVHKSTATSPMSKGKKGKAISGHHEVKRNLNDVYDVDNPPKMSATKKASPSYKDGSSEEGKMKLLIPKQEK